MAEEHISWMDWLAECRRPGRWGRVCGEEGEAQREGGKRHRLQNQSGIEQTKTDQLRLWFQPSQSKPKWRIFTNLGLQLYLGTYFWLRIILAILKPFRSRLTFMQAKEEHMHFQHMPQLQITRLAWALGSLSQSSYGCFLHPAYSTLCNTSSIRPILPGNTSSRTA